MIDKHIRRCANMQCRVETYVAGNSMPFNSCPGCLLPGTPVGGTP